MSEIIYVYKDSGNSYKTSDFFETAINYTQEDFINFTIKELFSSRYGKIKGYCIPSRLRIVASKTPIDVEKVPKTPWLELKNGEFVETLRGIELLGKYVNKDGVFKKHAFKPRKLKNSRHKSVQKRRKSKSKKRSPKPRRR